MAWDRALNLCYENCDLFAGMLEIVHRQRIEEESCEMLTESRRREDNLRKKGKEILGIKKEEVVKRNLFATVSNSERSRKVKME